MTVIDKTAPASGPDGRPAVSGHPGNEGQDDVADRVESLEKRLDTLLDALAVTFRLAGVRYEMPRRRHLRLVPAQADGER